MGCDYYKQSELVIEYIDTNGISSIIRTNRILQRGYICIERIDNYDSDDDITTQHNKYKEEIQRIIHSNTYIKILYESEKWITSSYETRYSQELTELCPRMTKLVKVYRKNTAWESDYV